MSKQKTILLSCLYLAVTAFIWDAKWHIEIGRDTFWIPPHDLMYGAFCLALILSAISMFRYRTKLWTTITLIFAGIPLGGWFDDLWHDYFGKEKLNSAWVAWSPPHLFIVAVLLSASTILCFKVKDKKETHPFNYHIWTATVLGSLFLLSSPLLPLGPYHIMGFAGEIIVTGAYILALLYIRKAVPHHYRILPGVLLFLISLSLGPATATTVASGVSIGAFAHPPFYVIALAYLVPALFIDFAKTSKCLVAIASGIALPAIYYGTAMNLPITRDETLLLILFGTLGGSLAAALKNLHLPKTTKSQ